MPNNFDYDRMRSSKMKVSPPVGVRRRHQLSSMRKRRRSANAASICPSRGHRHRAAGGAARRFHDEYYPDQGFKTMSWLARRRAFQRRYCAHVRRLPASPAGRRIIVGLMTLVRDNQRPGQPPPQQQINIMGRMCRPLSFLWRRC